MGEYFILVNLEKKEYVNPHNLGLGAKIHELIKDKNLSQILTSLPWKNDKIVFVGDTSERLFFNQIKTTFKEVSNCSPSYLPNL